MIAFTRGPITVYRYGIMYFISFVIGYLFLYWLGKKGHTKQRPLVHYILTNELDNLMIAIIIGVMIGGRMGEIFIYNFSYYQTHPAKILAVREGGMSFIGGIVGVIASIGIFTLTIKKKHKDIKTTGSSLLRMLDHIVTMTPLGIMFGRIGNFLNRELYGIIAYNKSLLSSIQNNNWFDYRQNVLLMRSDIYIRAKKIGLIFNYGEKSGSLTDMRVNTNLLSICFEGLLLFMIIQLLYRNIYKKKGKHAGRLSGYFLVLYSIVRFLLEFLRQDSQNEIIAGLSYSQRRFIAFFILGITLILYRNPRMKTRIKT